MPPQKRKRYIHRKAHLPKIEKEDENRKGQKSGLPSQSRPNVVDDMDRITNKEVELAGIETVPLFLPYFPRALFATILEDVITSINILDECNNYNRVIKMNHSLSTYINRKYDIAQPAKKSDPLDEVDPTRLGCDEYKLYKFDRDRECVLEVVRSTYRALVTECNFRPLWNYCQEVLEREQRVIIVNSDNAQNKLIARTLKRQLRQQRIQQRSLLYENDGFIDHLQRIIYDAEETTAIKARYTDNWQRARTEQHADTLNTSNGVYTENIGLYKRNVEQESVIHGNIETLTTIIIQETHQKVEDIMEKYEKDMEAIDLKIQICRNNLAEETEQRVELQKTIKSHEKEMKEWMQFKKDRAVLQKYQRDMTRSAEIVQAWWRGILVRLKLGPFQPPRATGNKK